MTMTRSCLLSYLILFYKKNSFLFNSLLLKPETKSHVIRKLFHRSSQTWGSRPLWESSLWIPTEILCRTGGHLDCMHNASRDGALKHGARSGLGYIARPRDPDRVQLDLNHGLDRSLLIDDNSLTALCSGNKILGNILQSYSKGRSCPRWSRRFDKHASKHSPLQAGIVYSIFFLSWYSTYLRSCNIASTFPQQAALCPRIRGTRQPTHRPSEWI